MFRTFLLASGGSQESVFKPLMLRILLAEQHVALGESVTWLKDEKFSAWEGE